MNTWNGGIHKHPNGYYAYVPKKGGGAGYRKFCRTKKDAEVWQDNKGREEWGVVWPVIKETGGYESRLVGRNRKAKSSIKVAPGVTIVKRNRVNKNTGTITEERLVRVTYMEILKDGTKRQKMQTFSFGTEKSRYTLEEAVKKAIAVRKKAERKYSSAQ